MNDVQNIYEIHDETSQGETCTDPSYEVDFLGAIEDQPEPDNMIVMGAEFHAMCNEANRDRDVEFVRHSVWNRRWRPGKKIKIEVGQCVRVEKATCESSGEGLPDEPKSRRGQQIKRERERQQQREQLATLNAPVTSRLQRW